MLDKFDSLLKIKLIKKAYSYAVKNRAVKKKNKPVYQTLLVLSLV